MKARPPNDIIRPSRREALGCIARWSGAAVVWSVAGGVPHALGATNERVGAASPGALTFVQISDTHIGFRKDANPDVVGSLRRAIADINGLPQAPAFVVHTGDLTHLSKPEQFGQVRELLQELHVDRVHTVPGEHDAIDDGVSGYLRHFDHDGKGRAWYSFDQAGVHFVGLNNVLNFKLGTLAALGDEQLGWLKDDLANVSHSTPVVVLAHIPMWTIWAPWGWGTADSEQAMSLLRPFGSVTVLNGHIHQVLQKVEGNVELHTAMSLAYPLPTPGQAGIGEPGPVTVPAAELGKLLGTRRVEVVPGSHRVAMIDTSLTAAAGSTVQVNIDKFAFTPKDITIAPGTSVVWTNHDQTPHTIAAGDRSFVSKGLDTGDAFEHTFASEGDFAYVCTMHPFMTGVVHVKKP